MTSILGEFMVDIASSLIPGISGAVQGYKHARFEKNITTFTEDLYSNIDKFRSNLENKTIE